MMDLPLAIDGKEYIENVSITIDEIKDYLRKGILVKTSQAPLGTVIEMYDKLLEEYDEVIHIPLSSKLSGMYQSSLVASKAYDGRVHVIDARTACIPIAYLCHDIKQMLDKGFSPLEIKERCEKGGMLEACIIPHDINYLKMGGRISPAAAALAGLLKIVPILYIDENGIDVFDKVRTEKKALVRMMDPIMNVDDYKDYHWIIIHDERDEDAAKIKAEVEALTKQEVRIYNLGGTIISHTGPGTFCFGRLKRIDR